LLFIICYLNLFCHLLFVILIYKAMVHLKPKKKLIITFLIFVFLISTGAKCGALPKNAIKDGRPDPVTIKYWSVFEESSNMQELISQYQTQNPHVTIEYRNFRSDEYEEELLNALAEDRGPDIFSIQTTWMKKYQPKIQPLPAEIKRLYALVAGTFKKETFTGQEIVKTPTLRDIKVLYPDVVYDNQVIDGQIWGLPLSIDTLALFYNRDLLNNAGIALPAKDWTQFASQVAKLSKTDTKGNVLQAGAAIGTANNVSRASDILALLMMQNGVQMADERGFATFNQNPPGTQVETLLSAQALNFYTSFANPATAGYTWNNTMPSSLQSFMAGKAAYFFGYSYNIPVIKTQAPKLRFEITTVPQIGTNFNFANYWVESVSKKSQHADEAWDFILFLATNKDNNKKYLETNRKPAALRELIASQLDDIELSPFANQLLTSRSWYKGKDPQAAEQIILSMINDALAGIMPVQEIIYQAVARINQTL